MRDNRSFKHMISIAQLLPPTKQPFSCSTHGGAAAPEMYNAFEKHRKSDGAPLIFHLSDDNRVHRVEEVQTRYGDALQVTSFAAITPERSPLVYFAGDEVPGYHVVALQRLLFMKTSEVKGPQYYISSMPLYPDLNLSTSGEPTILLLAEKLQSAKPIEGNQARNWIATTETLLNWFRMNPVDSGIRYANCPDYKAAFRDPR